MFYLTYLPSHLGFVEHVREVISEKLLVICNVRLMNSCFNGLG